MKKIVIVSSVVGLALGSGACERHAWEDTKALHEQHGHGAGDAGHGGHAADAAGGEHGSSGQGDKAGGH